MHPASEQPELWASTRKYYSQLEQELAAFREHDVSNQHYAADVVAAARSVGYFRFCDLARNQQGDPNVIRDDWALALQTAQNMPTRKKELDDKLKFLPALSSSNTDLSCQRECSLDEDAHPIPASMVIEGGEYYEWRFDSNRPLKDIELDNTNRKTGNGISLAVCNQPECTGQVHAVLTRKAAIREAIATWDVSTPPGSSIDIYMTPRIDGKWDSPLLVAHWSNDRAVKTSVNSSSEHARIATDTLVVSHPDGADAIRLSLRLHSRPAAASPLVRSIGLSVSGRDAPIVEDLDVPTISQMAQPDGDKKCSPTSVAMLTGYWASKTPGAWSPTTSDVIDGVFDPAYGWGNWSFNVAYVNSASNGTMRAFVTRLRSLDELATLVTSTRPVMAIDAALPRR
ncbi:MAG TPA: C39 family peptidase, partial [Kofleriaceae bacterium]